MNWKHWLDKGDIQEVHVNRKTLADWANLVDRDLDDAQVVSLSADRRFAIAYNAALNLANYVIRKNGYRVAAKVGHHRIFPVVNCAGSALFCTLSREKQFEVPFRASIFLIWRHQPKDPTYSTVSATTGYPSPGGDWSAYRHS